MSESLISSFLVSDVSESLIWLTKNERPWAIRSGCAEEMSDVSESLISLIFGQKTSNMLGNQKREFPAQVSIQSVHAVIGPNSCYVTFFHERDHVQKTQRILVDIEWKTIRIQ